MEITTDPAIYGEKEQLYFAMRSHEGRIYTDDELMLLPNINTAHRYYNEWRQRAQSLQRLKARLVKKFGSRQLNILDLGCGNGWMAARLHNEGHNVTGVDLNMTELVQAERVFGTTASLKWVYGNIFDRPFSAMRYDVCILAASCQYFPDLAALTNRLRTLTNSGGEIHLADFMLYSERELPHAKKRTRDYYEQLGFPGMSGYYYHHSINTAMSLGYRKLYPGKFSFRRNRSLQWWVLKR